MNEEKQSLISSTSFSLVIYQGNMEPPDSAEESLESFRRQWQQEISSRSTDCVNKVVIIITFKFDFLHQVNRILNLQRTMKHLLHLKISRILSMQKIEFVSSLKLIIGPDEKLQILFRLPIYTCKE